MSFTSRVIADIRLYDPSNGGRNSPTPSEKLGCIFELDGKNFECRLLLDETGPLHPGQGAIVPIVFLLPYEFNIGDRFYLRESRRIGEGTILEINPM